MPFSVTMVACRESLACVEIARRFGAPSVLGAALRVHGRLTGDQDTLQEAVARLGGAPTRLELARAQVDLGATKRRHGARRESRELLRAGHELALQCHARGVAEHARRELAASGVHIERGDLARRDKLTPSERRIADMAAKGASNKAIAQSLFLTVKTVEMHLSNAYRKLDIRSRRDLAAALAGSDNNDVPDEARELLTGARPTLQIDRVLATVLFTDIVSSTEHASAVGDREWRELLDRHDLIAERCVKRHDGTLVKSTGDGMLATFSGPARAIWCAVELRQALRSIGLTVRAGVHTGEVELRGSDVAGVAVHTAARVSALAGADEILVSKIVTDLVPGSGITFLDKGEHNLKGMTGSWRLFTVADQTPHERANA